MTRTARGGRRKILIGGAVAVVALVALGACGHLMMHGTGAERPASSEFGFGPRASAHGLYSATLEPVQPIRVRRMQTMRVVVTDAAGAAVEDARIAVDGGMPQHGHGLPTQPRVTRYLGDGAYEVEGVKFNMDGWWQFQLAIASDAGADTVTFHLDL